jgi:hypoxanthine phosphoribosyltransferase
MPTSSDEARLVLANADCCYTKAQVETALDEMAEAITATLQDSNPLVLCVLNGGLIVTSELLLRLPFPLHCDYIHATRYRGETRGGELNWIAKSSHPLKGRHVLIIDDILDEGLTLEALLKHCREEGAASVRSAVLVNKLHDRKADLQADFVGLDVEDRYVFGYGMDYKGYLRNAPGIYAVSEQEDTSADAGEEDSA